ncbi:hypothetical protein TRVA0_054S00188 [Trichomonascus vanleenenianus]|uniref:uncharacterized protein n=1 Tax=Trichomonascus vanleenenianus TaxID=2268995 RepID=UPI003ECA387B
MVSLPSAIWLIVLQYLREYDYDIDCQLWRVRLVSRTLSALADSLIWRKVTLVYDPEYKGSSCTLCDLECPFKSLLDVVKWADWSERALKRHELCSIVTFLDTIKCYAGTILLEDRYSVIQHIEAAIEVMNGAEDMKRGNKLLRALLVWRNDRSRDKTTGIKAVTEALTVPFRGYAKPKYYTEIHLYNIDGIRDIVARYYPYIKHVRLIVAQDIGSGKAIPHFAKIFEHSRLETVDATLKSSYDTNILERKKQIKILQEIVKHPPQRLLIDVKYRLTHDIVKALNKLSSDGSGTQLIIKSEVHCDSPVDKLTANIVSMKVRGMVDIARLQQSLSLHKSLAHLDISNFYGEGNLQLPDSVIDFTVSGPGPYSVKKATISGRYVKSLRIGDSTLVSDAFVFPELEYLHVLNGGVCPATSGKGGQRPFPKLKRLECDNTQPGSDCIAFLEAIRPSHSVILQYNAPPVDWQSRNDTPRFWSLLFSRHLPPSVTFIRRAPTKLLPDDLYFFQRLLARQSISQVHIISHYSWHPFDLEEIPAKYRTLVSSTSSLDNGIHICDTYAINPDFVKARLKNFTKRLRHLLATSAKAKWLLANLDR